MYWFILITSIAFMITVLFSKDLLQKKQRFLLATPIASFLVLYVYIGYIQYDSKRNMNAITDHFSHCDGLAMMPYEDPVIVNACGHQYEVRAQHGEIIYIKQTD